MKFGWLDVAIIIPLVVVLVVGGYRIDRWWHFDEDDARFVAIDTKIDANWAKIEDNLKLLEEADRTIAEELLATRARTDLAHDRIQYYRDVLFIVSKTCPGRMKLPELEGDPINK